MKRIVLCRPSGPRNVGAILRAALNFGPAEVVITAPARPSLLIHPDFELMSHGGEAARAAIRVVDTIDEALEGCHHAIAFTARARQKQERVDWRKRAPEVQPMADSEDECLALVFGNEETGLTREEAAATQELAHLRTRPEHTSLNLSQAVIVVLHSLFTDDDVHQNEGRPKRLDHRSRQFLIQRMKDVFVDEIARTPSAAEDIGDAIDRVFGRASLEPRDARAWHLMLRALGNEATPLEYGLGEQAKDARRKDALSRHRARKEGEGESDAADPGTGSTEDPGEGLSEGN